MSRMNLVQKVIDQVQDGMLDSTDVLIDAVIAKPVTGFLAIKRRLIVAVICRKMCDITLTGGSRSSRARNSSVRTAEVRRPARRETDHERVELFLVLYRTPMPATIRRRLIARKPVTGLAITASINTSVESSIAILHLIYSRFWTKLCATCPW